MPIEGEPAWEWLSDHWAAFAEQTWLERRQELLTELWAQSDREGRAGRLVGYRSQAEAASGPPRSTTSWSTSKYPARREQPEEFRHPDPRIVQGWTDSGEDHVPVLPEILS